jgi:hypothetical protein
VGPTQFSHAHAAFHASSDVDVADAVASHACAAVKLTSSSKHVCVCDSSACTATSSLQIRQRCAAPPALATCRDTRRSHAVAAQLSRRRSSAHPRPHRPQRPLQTLRSHITTHRLRRRSLARRRQSLSTAAGATANTPRCQNASTPHQRVRATVAGEVAVGRSPRPRSDQRSKPPTTPLQLKIDYRHCN